MRNPALSGDPPKKAQPKASQQQAKAADHAPAAVAQPNAQHSQASQGCPGTHETRFDCNSVSAIANVRQADAAEWFNNLAGIEIGVGLATAIAAILAARWAKQAAKAGTNSYKAFVAAEDACLAIEFPNASYGESFSDGVRRSVSYHFTAVITNIGRSTARVHDCTVRSHMVTVDKTLKPGDSETLGWSIMVESFEQFRMVTRYTSPIRTNAMLVTEALPKEVDGGSRFTADVIDTYIVDDE